MANLSFFYHANSVHKCNVNPITGDLFSVALKPLELLTYKFVTFPKYYISKERTEFILTIEGESGLYNRIETTWYRWINSILLIFVNPGLE